MREHELRRQVVGEMHLRRWPLLRLPIAVFQWVLEVAPGERDAEWAHVAAHAGEIAAGERPRHVSGHLGAVGFTWERQNEGTTLTLFCPGAGVAAMLEPAAEPVVAAAIAWARGLPGAIQRATAIWVCESEAEAEAVLPRMTFAGADTVSCRIAGGARIWSDFRLQPDGVGRLLVAAGPCDPRDLTRVLQQLQELGNYRNKALMGLPVAREAWPRLDAAEKHLGALAAVIGSAAARDDDLLAHLSDLSLELSTIATAIDYRMSATAAYSRLVAERLAGLAPEPIRGFASLADFTERRFLPAVRTCAALTERERQLTTRAAQLSALLRVRIETRIENQNAQLLHSMERSTAMQLRLQHLVEGLSVVAVSYYLVGLVGYGVKGAAHRLAWLDAEATLALLVVPAVLTVWLGLHALKKRVLGEH